RVGQGGDGRAGPARGRQTQPARRQRPRRHAAQAGRQGDPLHPRRRGRHRLPGRLPRQRHRLRRSQRQTQPRPPVARPRPALRPAGRPRHPAAPRLPGRVAQPEPRAGRGGGEVTMAQAPPQEERLIAPGHTFGSITDKISAIVTGTRAPLRWWLALALTGTGVVVLTNAIGYLLLMGPGIWGLNAPVMWGFDIVNFVWWIGIGHAGTLISAILLLLRQKWRTSINRFAEAMTLFAVACAGLYPLLHMGRPWLFYWPLPYPNTRELGPQWRSPLVWDVFAVSTYATVSFLFWFVGLIPDMATLRDRSQTWLGRVSYGILAMGWRGSAVHWHRYETAYNLLAGIATPLVVSVHTIVSFDFSIGIIPGWHATIFPPYFVAGAIYAGFAMVLLLTIPLRKIYGLESFITMRHM